MNSMADNQKVYQAIKTIADELCKENKTLKSATIIQYTIKGRFMSR